MSGRTIRGICFTGSVVLVLSLSSAFSGYAQTRTSENDRFCRSRVKIAKPALSIKFVTSALNYHPGESTKFRIDNVGRISIGLIGEDFSLEHFINGRWKIAPESPRVFSKIRLGILGPGKSGFCRTFTLPTSIALGHYRFRKVVTVHSSHKPKQVTASFYIQTG